MSHRAELLEEDVPVTREVDEGEVNQEQEIHC